MFGHIVPCGIADRGVTSLQAEGLDVADGRRWSRPSSARAAAGFGAGGDRATRTCVHRSEPPSRRSGDAAERPLLRRLRQAGVAPEDGLRDRAAQAAVGPGAGPHGQGATGSLGATVHDLGLVTVCEEAGCPNIYECWSDGTATFMINGERCTRACGFCQVDTRHPLPLSPDEPERVAEAVARMGLGHAVVTCVARDDLADGGAGAMAQTSGHPGAHARRRRSRCSSRTAGATRLARRRSSRPGPDVLNHNIETVARLQRAVRPSAGYARSLGVLARAGAAGTGDQVGTHGRPGRARGRGRRHHGGPARRSASPSSPSASTCGRAATTCRCRATGRPRSSTACARSGAALGRGPRGGVATHPVELPRPRGGRRRHRSVD